MTCVALCTGDLAKDLSAHLYGDKDLWKSAWRMTGSTRDACPFFPALLGRAKDGGGTAIAHRDLDGEPLLVHSCMRKLYPPREEGAPEREWTYSASDGGLSGHGVRVETGRGFLSATMTGEDMVVTETCAKTRDAEDACARDVAEVAATAWFRGLPP